MKVYVDTSVTLRVLFREPKPLPVWGKWTEAYASRLWLTEALRTLDRVRGVAGMTDSQVALLRRDIDLVHGNLHIIPLTERILARAGESLPTIIGTLDAIHLATALYLRDTTGLDLFLTHDAQLATAASASGFTVEGV